MVTLALSLICCHCQRMFSYNVAKSGFAVERVAPDPFRMNTTEKLPRHYAAQAIRNLRYTRSKTLEEVAQAVGMTRQGVSKWELGKSPLPQASLLQILEFLDVTYEQFYEELRRVAAFEGATLEPVERQWWQDLPANLEVLEVNDEDMSPYVEPNERVFFERGRRPKRTEGCVVELLDAPSIVRIYEKQVDDKIYLRSFNPDKIEAYQWDKISAIHRITFRGDR